MEDTAKEQLLHDMKNIAGCIKQIERAVDKLWEHFENITERNGGDNG